MPRSKRSRKRVKVRPAPVQEPWVCWRNNQLDFRENDITFTIKAAKRIEAILIHHYGIEKESGGKEQHFMNIIDKSKGFVGGNLVKQLHEFRMTRNSLVHNQDCDQLGKSERLGLNSDVLKILGSLNKGCSCKETQFNTFKVKKADRFKEIIILPDDDMFLRSTSDFSKLCSKPEPQLCVTTQTSWHSMKFISTQTSAIFDKHKKIKTRWGKFIRRFSSGRSL